MKSLPLVKLSLLRPLLGALRERGVDPATVLERVGLTEGSIRRDDEMVHVMVIHQFLETCAEAVEDPTFCTSVGARLDPAGWPMIEAIVDGGGSLADFLTTCVSRSNEVAKSITAYLDIRGDRAFYGETRLFRPTIVPAQNDGFMVSLALSILKRALGSEMDPAEITLVVCDPSVLPASFSEFSRLKGDEMGFRIEFPSAWLVYSLEKPETVAPNAKLGQTTEINQFLSDLRSLIRFNIGQGGLNADDIAALVAMSRSKLARRLAKQGTSISKEIRSARLGVARERLRSTEETIDTIAAAVGYTDPANFSRAFREAEGLSPRAFRAKLDAGKR